MDRLKLILFDIGEVLIDSSDAFRTAAREQSIPFELLDANFDKYDNEVTLGKITSQELYLKCLEDNNLSADVNYNFARSWVTDYKIIKPTFDFLLNVYKKYPVGFLSNIYTGLVDEMLAQQKIPNVDYKYKFLSCDIGMQKPNADIYQYVLEQTQLKPQDILFIDNNKMNVQAAADTGMHGFLFLTENPVHSIKELYNEVSL